MRVELCLSLLLMLSVAIPSIADAAPVVTGVRGEAMLTPQAGTTRADQSTAAAQEKKKGKKKSKKKDGKGKDAQAQPVSEWKLGDTPMGTFLWLARQIPDLSGFASSIQKVELSTIAFHDKAAWFMDGCKLVKRRSGWEMSGCKATALTEKSFLSNLIRQGSDIQPQAQNTPLLDELMTKVRKASRLEDLEPLFLVAAMANNKGRRVADDVAEDIKSCSARRYWKALGSTPSVAWIGPNVVVQELTWVADKPGNFKVRMSLARTKDGWRVGSLRVNCY